MELLYTVLWFLSGLLGTIAFLCSLEHYDFDVLVEHYKTSFRVSLAVLVLSGPVSFLVLGIYLFLNYLRNK